MYLVYEKNYLIGGDVDCFEEKDVKLFPTMTLARADFNRRVDIYKSGDDFTYMENESSENCAVFADDLGPDGEHDGEFHICIMEVEPETKISRDLVIDKKRADFINTLLKMTGDEIYTKYGLKRDETITETVDFGNGYEMDIKLVICENEDYPYTEAVLFYHSSEVCCSDVEEEFFGEWELEDGDETYEVRVVPGVIEDFFGEWELEYDGEIYKCVLCQE